jgi:hypothetical protein
MWYNFFNTSVTAQIVDSTSVAGVRFVYAELSTGRTLCYKATDFKNIYFYA